MQSTSIQAIGPSGKENITIDVLKYLFACAIPLLHVATADSLQGTVAQYISRLGVPFFFAASGYFLSAKIEADPANKGAIAKRYILRIFKMYCIWEIIYAPLQLAGVFPEQGLRGLALWAQTLVMQSPSYLWYLVATIVGVFLFALTYRKAFAIPLAIGIYVIGTLMNSYRPFIDGGGLDILNQYYAVFLTTRNGVFFGFPLILVGSLVRSVKLSRRSAVLLFLLSVVLYIVEVTLVRASVPPSTDTSMYFTIPWVILLLLVLATQKDSMSQLPWAVKSAKRLRFASTVIYVAQYGLIWVSTLFMPTEPVLSSLLTWCFIIAVGTTSAFLLFKNRVFRFFF